jgi:hypothetical protein
MNLKVKRSRLIIALLTAPAAGPLVFLLLQIYWFGISTDPVPFLEAAVVVWALYAWPAYAGALLFGVPLALIYLRLGVTSWMAYGGGGLLCALATAMCLILTGNRPGLLVQINQFGFFVILYGLLSGTCVRATLFGFRTSGQVRFAVDCPAETARQPIALRTKFKKGWLLLLLIIVPPIGPLISLFIDLHPYGIPSGSEQAIISVLAFAVSLAAPLYVEGLLFAVPLALFYQRFHVTSWLACAVGGVVNASAAVGLLRATGQTVEILGKPAAILALLAGYGALSAITLHTFLLASAPSESNGISEADPKCLDNL